MTISGDVYVDGRRLPEPLTLADAMPAVAADGGFIWVDLDRPSPDELAEVTVQLGLPTLAVHDSARIHTRPKLEVHSDIVVIVLKTIRYVDQEKIAVSGEISFVLSPTFIVSIRQDDSVVLSEVRTHLISSPTKLKRWALFRCCPSAPCSLSKATKTLSKESTPTSTRSKPRYSRRVRTTMLNTCTE